MWSIIINLNKSATASSCVCAMLKQFLMYFHTKTKSLRLRFAIAKERRKEIWQQWRILVTLVQQNLESMFCSLFHISFQIRDFASPVRSLSLTMQAWALVMLSIMFLELQFPETNNPSFAYHHWEQRVDKKSQAHVKCMKFSSTNHQNGKQTTHMVESLLRDSINCLHVLSSPMFLPSFAISCIMNKALLFWMIKEFHSQSSRVFAFDKLWRNFTIFADLSNKTKAINEHFKCSCLKSKENQQIFAKCCFPVDLERAQNRLWRTCC